MFVVTSHENGTFYYALTAVTGGNKDKTVTSQNIAGPVNETVEPPEPLLMWQAAGKKARLYLQYIDLDSLKMREDYKINAWPYWVGLKKDNVDSAFKFRYFNNSKARRILNWRPKISFNRTIRDTIIWMDSR